MPLNPLTPQYVALRWRDLFSKEVAPKMVEQPVSKSLFKGEAKYESLDLGDTNPKLDRDVMLNIFDETFEASSVQATNSTELNGSNITAMLSRWFAGD